MSGSLIKIQETTVSSTTASVTLTGIDSTYDVYMVKINNMLVVTDGQPVFRVTESGTPNTTSNYDRAGKLLRSVSGFSNFSNTNLDKGYLTGSNIGNSDNESGNLVMYIFNANNSSEYTFFSQEATTRGVGGELRGGQGGSVFTSSSAIDGIQFFNDSGSGNIASGTFTLYGLKK